MIIQQTPTTSGEIRAIADIRVGKRHRHHLGDIEALAQNIADIGFLMHPVVITSDNNRGRVGISSATLVREGQAALARDGR